MTRDDLRELFEKHDAAFLHDKELASGYRKSARPDLCAFVLLDALLPGNKDMVACAEHDEIWLDVDLDLLAEIVTEADVLALVQCGVRIDDEVDSLAMYV